MSCTNASERVQSNRPIVISYNCSPHKNTKKDEIPLCFREAAEDYNDNLDEAFLNTTGTATVTNLWGTTEGNVTVVSNVQPQIVKTGDKNSPFKLVNDVIFNI